MKRVLTFFLLAAPCFAAHEFTFPHPNIPAPRIIEAIEPDPQTHTFPALDTNNIFTGSNTFSGSLTVSGTATFNGIIQGLNNTSFTSCTNAGIAGAGFPAFNGAAFPLGPNENLVTCGPADLEDLNLNQAATTTTANLSVGVNTNILVGSTALLAPNTLGNTLTLAREIAGKEELISSGNWSIVDGTHINVTCAFTHSGTTTIEQGPGAAIHQYANQVFQAANPAGLAGRGTPVRMANVAGNVVLWWPASGADPWPFGGLGVGVPLTGIANGAVPATPTNLLLRNASSSTSVIHQTSAGVNDMVLSDTGPAVSSLNKIIFVDQQAGATADVQITNCIAALPAAGGTCDARGFGATTQTLAANVTFSSSKPVDLVFDKATTLSVSGVNTTPFTIAEGTRILNATFSLPASYAVPVITNTGNIGTNQNSKTQLANITCTGTDTTAGGGCISLSVSTGFIDAMQVNNVQVFKLAFGVKLSTTGSGFINGNWFNGGFCSLTVSCHNLNDTSTGQVSLNTFISWYEEMNTATGQHYIDGSCTSSGLMLNNRWIDAKIFDPPGGNPVVMVMPSGSCAARWNVEGFLNLRTTTVTDAGGVGNMCDSSTAGYPCFNTGPSGTGGFFIPVFNAPQVSQTQQGFFNVDGSGRTLYQNTQGTHRFEGPGGAQTDLVPIGTGSVYIRVAGTPQKAETGADASLVSFTPPAVQGDYWACIQMAVSAVNTPTLGWTITYKDSNGTAQSPTNLALNQVGVAAPALTFTPAVGNNFFGCVNFSIDNSATPIVIKTTFSGTSIAYKATGSIGIQQ